MKNCIKIVGFLFLFPNFIWAQGTFNFSQFNSSILHLNPATAGVFYGGVRAVSSYKDQYTFTGNSFRTIGLAIDATILDDITNNDFFAVGLIASSDDFGDFAMTNNSAYGILTYGRALDAFEEHFFSLGFQGGYVLHQADFNQFLWENQWQTSGFNQGLPSREPMPFDNNQYFDFSAGVNYFYSNHSTLKFHSGLAMHHIAGPIVNYYNQVEQLFRRFNAHMGAEIGSEISNLTIMPSAMFSAMGPNRLFMFGSEFGWRLQDASQTVGRIKEVNFSLGTFVRWNDGAFFTTRIDWGGFGVGFAYDFNLSGMFPASRGLGGPEVMLLYKSGYKKGYGEKHKNKRFE